MPQEVAVDSGGGRMPGSPLDPLWGTLHPRSGTVHPRSGTSGRRPMGVSVCLPLPSSPEINKHIFKKTNKQAITNINI